LTYLHSFGASGDGTNPYGPLVSLNGTLYGTTLNATGVCGGGGACGTQLVSLGGVMYGTTLSGGQYNHGTVYSIAPSGAETVLHSFGGSSADGENPYGGLLNVNGTLYGTTSGGGTYGQGTLYSITPNGTESVLWSFGNQYDGAKPRSSLININGLLYGTTIQGGTNGSGTVFTLSL
jgi:uncharacterized repeat protein (TIGR03803 family)